MVRPLALDAIRMAQDVGGGQGLRGSSRSPGCCDQRLPLLVVFAKVIEVDPVTTARYRRTVAFVKVDDTMVNEELIWQKPARVFTRYCNRPICHAKSGSYWRPRHGRGSGASG